jgi:thiamine-phosphate pyrophosphorylase
MTSRKKPCHLWRLYVIADAEAAGTRPIEEVVSQAIEGGADVIQLRHKKAADEELLSLAQRLKPITQRAGVPLIVNDRVEVARRAKADGVHLGQGDGPLSEARLILGETCLIGRSTHSPAQALKAVREGFDYLGVGPVFKTPTKPTYAPVGLELVRFAAKNIPIPFVAIGGIDETNVEEVRSAGAKAVAVVRAVMGSKNPKEAAREIKERITFVK